MITHRRVTRAHSEPPVRFYKSIAITFLLVTVLLLAVVIFFTSKKATIIVMAKDDPKSVNFTVNVASGGRASGAINGIVTTTVFSHTEKYFPTGNKTVDGVAEGEVIIYNKTNSNQPLISTTRLLTSSGILLRLSDRVMVPANGQVTAKVYADQPGASGDIGPSAFTIPGLSTEKQRVIYAESKQPMRGGVRTVGVLTEEDINSAKADYANKVRALASGAVSSTEVWANQKVVQVGESEVAPDRKAGEEVTEFNLSGTTQVTIVFVNKEELSEKINEEVDNNMDLSVERAVSVDKEPSLSVAGYDLQADAAQLSVVQEALTTLESNADRLAVSNFFGKSKDEIERYVLGLSHVAGVEVKFSPGWMRSAPSVPDHVKVVVRSVR